MSCSMRPLRLTTSPRLGGAIKMYGQTAKGQAAAGDSSGGGEIGKKARSTAEEFTRIAEEKAEGVKESLWKKAKDKLSHTVGKEKP